MNTFKNEKLPYSVYFLIKCHDYYLGKLRGWGMGALKRAGRGGLI